MPDDPQSPPSPEPQQPTEAPDAAVSPAPDSADAAIVAAEHSPTPAPDVEGVQPPPALMLDVHSAQFEAPLPTVPLDASAFVAEGAPTTMPAAPTTPTPTSPIVGATVQATQTVVSTTKQATQQVTAAVQQGAQKVTVAPRKAIYRGKRFLIGYGALTAGFGLLAALARRYKYFPADVGITRILQRPNARLYDRLMHAVSNLGWRWISVGTRASLSTLMWLAGFRMEGAFTLATWSGDVVTVLIKTRVLRPRPTKDLVRVASDLDEASFPSGHVVHYVTFYGFLYYLVHTHLKRRWFRALLLSALGGIITLVGPSRIYMGHHWPSDVGGAYFVGTLWLGITIIAYLETKANYTLHTHPPFLVKRPQQLG